MPRKTTTSTRETKASPAQAKASPTQAKALPAKRKTSPSKAEAEALRAQLAEAQQAKTEAKAILRRTQARLEGQEAVATEELRAANEDLLQQSAELSHTVQTLSAKEAQLSKLTRLHAMLSQVNQAIVRTHEDSALFQEVCRIVADGGFPLAWIGQVRNQQVVPVAWWGPAAEYLKMITVEIQGPFGQGPTGTCIRENRSVVNEDFTYNPATLPWRESALRFGLHASAAFPLCREGQAVACLTLYSPEPKAFDSDQVNLLQALAADVSYALDALSHEQRRRQAEAALRESEARYRLIIQHAPAGIYEIDFATGRFTEVNDVVCLILGYTREELLAMTAFDIMDDESRALFAARIRRGQSGDKPEEAVEYRVKTKDGRLIWALLSATFRWKGKAITGATVVATDITERKRAEEARQRAEQVIRDQNQRLQVQNEELAAQRGQLQNQYEALAAAQMETENQRRRLEAVLEALPVGVAITDAAGSNVQANTAFEQIWGGPLPVAGYAADQAWWLETGRPVALHEWASAQAVQTGLPVAGQVLELQRFDGSRAVVINSAAPVRDAQGQIVGSAVALEDITALEKAEEQLAYQARLLSRVHDAIIGMNEQLRITYWNQVAQEMYGWTEAEALGLTTRELFQSRPIGPGWAQAVETLERTGQFEGEVYHQRKDGTVILVHTRSASIRDSQGNFRGVVTSLRDITARRQLEDELRRARDEMEARVRERTAQLEEANAGLEEEIEERRKNHDEIRRLNLDLEQALTQEQAMHQQLVQAEKLGALGRMIGSVAHEFNNPLQTVTNCLYLAGSALPPDSAIHQYLEMAGAETERMVRLVAQLRELYRPRAVPPEMCDLAPLLQSVRALMAPQLYSGQVEWLQPADLPSYPVCILPDRITQVLINVATNAIEAMQPAGGQLRVEMAPSADGRQVGVRFEDTGPGILPENLSRLFEPFFTTKPQGLGLGLAICYEIAQQHGGQITAESQRGQGAVFTIWLPLVQPPESGFTKETLGDQPDVSR